MGRRITLNKQHLFRAVGVLTGIVIVYMIVWTVVDPPVKEQDYQLTDTVTDDESTIVTVGYYCRSTRGLWSFVSVGFQALLLLCASVLAFTTRKMKNDVNETTTVALLIYWNFICVLLRTILIFLQNQIG